MASEIEALIYDYYLNKRGAVKLKGSNMHLREWVDFTFQLIETINIHKRLFDYGGHFRPPTLLEDELIRAFHKGKQRADEDSQD